MSKKLQELYDTYAYDSRQKNQLRIADEKGLDLDRIKDPRYDWQQMREIILAMEYGIDPAPLCDSSISSESMENIRIHLFEQQGVFADAKTNIMLKRIKVITILIIFVAIFSILLAIMYLNKDYIISYYENIELDLKSDYIQLSYGEAFHPADYVKAYNKKNKLILPEIKKMNHLGDYEYVYKVTNGVKSVEKTMVVTIVDKEAPIIVLKSDSITIEQSSHFNALEHVDSVSDNYDNVSIENITYDSNVDTSKVGKFTVLYSLTDLSGNKTTKVINVIVERKQEINQAPVHENTAEDKENVITNHESNDLLQTIPSSKVFYIRDYDYDIAKCKEAAVSYMNSQLDLSNAIYGELQPYQENCVTLGYKVIFKE